MIRERAGLNPLTATANQLFSIGNELRAARLRRGKTIENWAAAINCSTSTVRRMEAGDPSVAIHHYFSALAAVNKGLAKRVVDVVATWNREEAVAYENRRFSRKCRGRNRQRMIDRADALLGVES